MRNPLLAALLFASLLASGSATALTLKIATIAPEGSSWMSEMREAAAGIAERTEGRVKFKFYPGGVMGNDQTVLRKMRAGQLQGGAFTGGALGRILPDLDLYSLPLMFRDYAEVDYVRSRMDAELIAELEDAGFVVLALSDNGFAYLMSARPLRRVGDLSGARVWIPEDDIMSETALEVTGVSPIQLPLADVYTALQTGVVDTVAAPPIGAIAFQWNTKVKYLTDVPMMYLSGVFAIDAKSWRKIRPEDQEVVAELVSVATAKLDSGNRAGEENARGALAQQGIEFVSASSPDEIERWQALTEQALVQLRATGRYSNERIDRMQGYLEEYRAGGGSAGGR